MRKFEHCGIPELPEKLSGALRWLAALTLLALISACSWLPFAPRSVPDCPAEIRSTDEIPGDFTIRQRITVETDGEAFPFELIAQKKGDELVLIGFSPIGAKLFTVIQTGLKTQVDALPSAALPVPPLNILRDLHHFLLSVSNVPTANRDRFVYHNASCHYTIIIETLSEEPLP